jgi:hypothetical protein
MSPELEQALRAVSAMKYPSVADLLRKYRYEYEAEQVEALVTAWEAQKREAENV